MQHAHEEALDRRRVVIGRERDLWTSKGHRRFEDDQHESDPRRAVLGQYRTKPLVGITCPTRFVRIACRIEKKVFSAHRPLPPCSLGSPRCSANGVAPNNATCPARLAERHEWLSSAASRSR